ncbi:glycoside hydrolase family 47 protein [Scleroderma citrinum Foug A]|uniref:alpha-1,2-Mannosidase n=1 Tax=Scleroderma citrinum Foug A TaxID=1036808 RepID=A0A0C3AJN4_9AGAM|nr:glycoside hydrolase family 47 protein [Scleroderma citrinum Foug A]
MFNVSYTAYKTYAWGDDSLLVESHSYTNDRNGWGATIVDALDTMWIMGLYTWFDEAANYTATVDFSESQTGGLTNIFETTIRYLAGLLSAYELSGRQRQVLVDKAKELTDQMAYAWAGNNAMPYTNVDFETQTPQKSTTGIAVAGTLTLEWSRLSLYTGNDTYRQLAEKSTQQVIHMQDVLPGMPGQIVDPSTGKAVSSYVTWGGGSDSYFEYLIKYARLSNTNDNSYTDSWLTAVQSSIDTLAKRSTVGNWLYLADYDGSQVRHVGSHLACFYGGNWILGGKMTNNEDIVNIGLSLTDACWNTYASTATGIGPEGFAFTSSDGGYTGGSPPNANQTAFYAQHGFYITGADYILRPEVLESNFYAWRATGDIKYWNNAVSAVKSFDKYLRTSVAYTGIDNVDDTNSTRTDEMESFWFAETLKYLYLTFDDPEHISLDNYVFNTEAHPFMAPAALSDYGSGNVLVTGNP